MNEPIGAADVMTARLGGRTTELAERIARARRIVEFHASAVGQTFFVESPRVGVLAIAVLAIAAPELAISGLVVSVLARLAAERIHAPRDLLASGLIELNGWFLGLACGTFLAPGIGLAVALVAGGPLVAAASIVMRRVLATWDLPLFVGPYVPAFWLLFAGISAFPWAHPAVLPVIASSDASPIVQIALGGLRGLGEIYYVPDARVGLGLAVAATLYDRRLGISMVGASIAAVAIGYLGGAPDWLTDQGLAGYTPALMAVAALRGFGGIGRTAVVVAIVTGALLEAGTLRLTGAFGLYALSTSYLVFVWGIALLRPVRDASADRRGWSSAAAPPRARMFEH
jgi:urea transporter